MADDYSGKYLDGNGVSHLWAKIKATFALISHTHTKSDIPDFAHNHAISDVTSLQTTLNGKAPTNHKSTATTYGTGDASNYGHVKLSDAINGTGTAASGGTAATPLAVANALSAALNADVTYSDFTGASASAGGSHGLVPAPGAGEQYSVLLGNADFVALPEAIQLVTGDTSGYLYVDNNEDMALDDSGSLMTSSEKTKLAGIAAGAQVNSITGVKGNSESSYRTGNVNLTAANIGAAASSHAHGNITSEGDITAAAPTIASGDRLIINDESASKVTNGPSFGTSTTTYLRNDGTWATPTDTDTKVTQTNATSNRGFQLLLSSSGEDVTDAVTGSAYKSTNLKYNPSTKALSTGGAINGYTLAAACAKGVDTSIASGSTSTNLPTSAAVASAISAAMSDVAGALVYKGTVGTGGTVTDLPANHTKGWYYVVSTAGTYAGKTCEVGDMLICNTTGTTATNSHWDAVQSNITALTTTEIDAIVAAA